MAKHYEWARFWIPSGTVMPLDFDGFIPRPGTTSWRVALRGVRSYEALADETLLALEGEAGSGKTTSVIADSKGSVYVSAAGAESLEDLEHQIDIHLASNASASEIVVDGVDEVAFAERIRILLPRLLARGFKVRVVCRTSAWPATLRRELEKLSAKFFELVPLTRENLEVAAAAEGLDAASFVQSIHEKGVEVLAMLPLTAVQLLATFAEHGTLPSSRRTLFAEACRRHCEEHNLQHRDRDRFSSVTGVEARLHIMERLAAFSILCNRSAIELGPSEPSRRAWSLSIDELAWGAEDNDGSSVLVTERSIREAIDKCGLVSSTGANGVAIGHRSFAEFLAASYLTRRKVPVPQIVSLICHPDYSDLIPPQLRGLASDLASHNVAMARWLVRTNPDMLLQAELRDHHEDAKAQLIDDILAAAQVGKVARQHLASLHGLASMAHPGLALQLRGVIASSAFAFDARAIAIEIAIACQERSLSATLADLALDSRESLDVRCTAARALMVLKAEDVGAKLAPLLREQPDDPKDLRGCALTLLWPGQVPGADPFEPLTPPKRRMYGGFYNTFLGMLPQRLSVDLLPSALKWSLRLGQSYHADYTIKELVDDILRKGWEHWDEPNVLDALTDLIWYRITQFDSIFETDPDAGTQRTEGPTREARLAVVGRLAESRVNFDPVSILYSKPPLLTSGDFELALESLGHSGPSKREMWADAAERLLWWSLSVDTVETLLKHTETFPSVRTAFSGYLEGVEINSPKGDELRAAHARSREMVESRANAEPPPLPPLAERLDESLRRVERGEVDWWCQTVVFLAEDARRPGLVRWSCKILDSDRWKSLENGVRSLIVAVARRYLQERTDEDERWIGKNSYPFTAFAGYVALQILCNVGADLEFVNWTGWAAATIARWCNGSDLRDDPVLAHAYAVAPAAIREALRKRARGENESQQHVLIFRQMSRLWDAELESLALELAMLPEMTAASVGEILQNVLERRSTAGKDVVSRLVSEAANALEGTSQFGRAVEGLRELFLSQPDWALPMLDGLRANSILVRAALLRIAEGAGHELPKRFKENLSPKQMVNLYLWLGQEFPISEDPQIEEAHVVTPRESVGHYREAILRWVADLGTPEAMTALNVLGEADGRYERTRQRALNRTLEKTWQPVLPTTLRLLLTNARSRRVESALHLLLLVLEALGDLAPRLHGTPPLVQFLWNEREDGSVHHKKEESLSDFLQDHLGRWLLAEGIAVHREVQLRRGIGSDKGEHPDILVQATKVAAGLGPDILGVAIEVKGDWHKQAKTAIETQLANRYLSGGALRHGIYILGFFGRGDETARRDSLADLLRRSAERLSDGERVVRSVVLDCSWRLVPA